MSKFDPLWAEYVDTAAATFRATDDEKNRLAGSMVARFVALLPSIAGCEEAGKSGFMNLCLYIIERTGGKSYFLHDRDDDAHVLHRLDPFKRNMAGGDRKIVDSGMARLALVMLADYKMDMAADQAAEKYNPLVEGTWNFDEMKKELETTAAMTDSPELDSALPVDTALRSWWDK